MNNSNLQNANLLRLKSYALKIKKRGKTDQIIVKNHNSARKLAKTNLLLPKKVNQNNLKSYLHTKLSK